jgi:endonuclease YncB( thermonuclease family)
MLIALFAFWALGDQLYPREVIRADAVIVKDGDTLVLDKVTIRLYGIDAPEYLQICKDKLGLNWPCGKAARLQLASLAAAGGISCETRAEDKYGRKVAKCKSAITLDLAEELVKAGLAISPAERGSAAYGAAEADARTNLRGIWQGVFDTPAEWRTIHKGSSPLP